MMYIFSSILILLPLKRKLKDEKKICLIQNSSKLRHDDGLAPPAKDC
jgi:hypothetical protein